MDTQYCLLWASLPNKFIFQEYCLLGRCLLRQVLAPARFDCTDCYCMLLYKCYINNFNHILLVVSINCIPKKFIKCLPDI